MEDSVGVIEDFCGTVQSGRGGRGKSEGGWTGMDLDDLDEVVVVDDYKDQNYYFQTRKGRDIPDFAPSLLSSPERSPVPSEY